MRQNAFQKKKKKKKEKERSKCFKIHNKTFKFQPVCESVKRESAQYNTQQSIKNGNTGRLGGRHPVKASSEIANTFQACKKVMVHPFLKPEFKSSIPLFLLHYIFYK